MDGIRRRHSKHCPALDGRRCSCGAGWEAFVFSARDGCKVRRTFSTLAAAKAWRVDALAGLRKGTIRAPRPVTIDDAAADLVEGMRAGRVRTRSGDVYKPSVIRSYEAVLRRYVLPELGPLKLADVQRRDVQRLADDLLADGRDPSTIRNALMPLRVIYRRAIEDGDLAVNPCINLRLPAVRGRRDTIVSPEMAAALLAALAPGDRVLCALALYAGLRRGELMGLRWSDIDLAAGIIRVERSWDSSARLFVEPKSRAGRRKVPVAAALRDILIEHKMTATGELVVGRGDGQRPFNDTSVAQRALRMWNDQRFVVLQHRTETVAREARAAGIVEREELWTGMGSTVAVVGAFKALRKAQEIGIRDC